MASEHSAGNRFRPVAVLVLLLVAVAPWFPAGAAGEQRARPVVSTPAVLSLKVALPLGPEEWTDDDDPLHNDIILNEPGIDGEEMVGWLQAAQWRRARGKWAEALEAYYKVINSPVDYLYKQPGVDEDRIYIGMKEFCRRQMESFPARGKQIFRLRYDRRVMKMYKKAAGNLDLNTLRLIQFNYALSSYSDDAMMLAADILYEQGNLNEAFYCYDRLIRKHPDTDKPLELAFARLGMCALRIGPSTLPLLRERCKTLQGALGNSPIIIPDDNGRRREISLRKFIAEIRAKLEATTAPKDAGTDTSMIDPAAFRNLKLKWKVTRDLGQAGAWNAALFDDRLFVDALGANKGMKVFDVGNGKITNILGGNIWNGASFSSRAVPGNEVFPVTVTRDSEHYYAIIPQNLQALNSGGQSGKVERWTTRLQAFDIRTTKMRWWWEPEQRSENNRRVETSHNPEAPGCSAEDRDFMGQAYLTSAPVRYGAWLYAGAVRVSDSGSQEYFVICLDPTTGALKWRTYIGSINCYMAAVFGPRGMFLSPVTGSRVCAANDTVFFTSNMGAVGAVNSVTGDVKWVAKYQKPRFADSTNRRVMAGPPFTWHETPPILLRNVRRSVEDDEEETISMLLVAPRDSDCLYAFDPETGRRLWERPLFPKDTSLSSLEPPRTLTLIGEKAVIFQNAVSNEMRVHYEQQRKRFGLSRRPPQGSRTVEVMGGKVLTIDIATGKLASFKAYLGSNETLIGPPVMTGSMLFLLAEHMEKGKPVRAVLGYETDGAANKAVVWEDVTQLCEGKKISRMIISPDRIIFVCEGAIYAYCPAGGKPETGPSNT
jgi:outer membrane protein assembly factor BamB